jgi:hypothetical protein
MYIVIQHTGTALPGCGAAAARKQSDPGNGTYFGLLFDLPMLRSWRVCGSERTERCFLCVMGQYEGPDGTRRCAPAVPGATAGNGDIQCYGQRLPQVSRTKSPRRISALPVGGGFRPAPKL